MLLVLLLILSKPIMAFLQCLLLSQYDSPTERTETFDGVKHSILLKLGRRLRRLDHGGGHMSATQMEKFEDK